ncbi:hypothetical protein AYI70_g814 [Smittium culicis]|uniref:Uncharacterized protein n=1 Tax=Smittium culicis TaxID=133412 RepID=A0A1R1YFB5_9FUNG|nr:hypothetical protein AYI70_g814 [Smittium culicis]
MRDPILFSDAQFRELIGTISNICNNAASANNLSQENSGESILKAGDSIRITNIFGTDQTHYLRQKNSAAQYVEEFLNL